MTSLIVAFALALLAGVVVGMAAGRRRSAVEVATSQAVSQPPVHQGPGSGRWLDRRLGLSREQSEKIETIWEKTLNEPTLRTTEDQRMKLIHDRDNELYNLLNDQQKNDYQRIKNEYAARLGDLARERDAAMQKAIEQTKLVLSDAQRSEYEKLLAAQHGRDFGPHGPREHDREHGRGPRHGPPPNHGDGPPPMPSTIPIVPAPAWTPL